MNYFILTDTEFFRQIANNKDSSELRSTYCDFIKTVFDLCIGTASRCELLFAITYTETELQSLCETCRLNPNINRESDPCFLYSRKALSFIRHILKHIQTQVPPLSVSKDKNQTSAFPNFRWTGSIVELVEIIYGFMEMRSINNGETAITELASFISSQFGIEIKDCYSAYVDIKHRKNDSRTYYLDKMRERLNRRMELDDEGERMRK